MEDKKLYTILKKREVRLELLLWLILTIVVIILILLIIIGG